MNQVTVVGGGLAGSECALYLAKRGVAVKLIDIKPNRMTPCHQNQHFCELVCSNSLKSNDVFGNACGLLKEELRKLGSSVIAAADANSVPAGNALAVNRENFAATVTAEIEESTNITRVCEEFTEVDFTVPTVIATGPLTTPKLSEAIAEIVGGGLYFFDASAPIISAESIDMERAYVMDRYGTAGEGDHINCPLDRAEYEAFLTELLNAERAHLHDFEDDKIFSGCMPIEVMAAKGDKTLLFGTMKPAGLRDPKTGRWPYACVQLRKENVASDAYNLVGFQTNLLFPEQKRVFSMIPALNHAEFLRYGVMHRNTYINSPGTLCADYSLKGKPLTFFAGQLTGVEGYVESVCSGLMCAVNLLLRLKGRQTLQLDCKTVTGALAEYVSAPKADFQPMNANYAILEPPQNKFRDKQLKKRFYAERSLAEIAKIKEFIEEKQNV